MSQTQPQSGGSYVLDPATGQRMLVEVPTVDHPDGNAPRPAKEVKAEELVADDPATGKRSRKGD